MVRRQRVNGVKSDLLSKRGDEVEAEHMSATISSTITEAHAPTTLAVGIKTVTNRDPRGPFGAYQYSGRPSHSGGRFPYNNVNNHPVYGKYFSPVNAPVPPPYGYGFGQPPTFLVPSPFGRMPPSPYDFNAPHMHPSHFNPGPSPFQPRLCLYYTTCIVFIFI